MVCADAAKWAWIGQSCCKYLRAPLTVILVNTVVYSNSCRCCWMGMKATSAMGAQPTSPRTRSWWGFWVSRAPVLLWWVIRKLGEVLVGILSEMATCASLSAGVTVIKRSRFGLLMPAYWSRCLDYICAFQIQYWARAASRSPLDKLSSRKPGSSWTMNKHQQFLQPDPES
jgi:hypothetical protein